jgi:hemoglobin
MGEAHAGLSITGDAFDRVARHLVAILRESGVDEDTVGHITDSLGPLRPQIVTA